MKNIPSTLSLIAAGKEQGDRNNTFLRSHLQTITGMTSGGKRAISFNYIKQMGIEQTPKQKKKQGKANRTATQPHRRNNPLANHTNGFEASSSAVSVAVSCGRAPPRPPRPPREPPRREPRRGRETTGGIAGATTGLVAGGPPARSTGAAGTPPRPPDITMSPGATAGIGAPATRARGRWRWGGGGRRTIGGAEEVAASYRPSAGSETPGPQGGMTGRLAY